MKITDSDQISLDLTQSYNDLQSWLDQYCEKNGHQCWHHYGPADLNLYLNSSPRIMLVNSESGGYEGCARTPHDEYIKWIQRGFNTPCYSSVFVSAIRKHFDSLAKGDMNTELKPYWYSDCFKDKVSLAYAMRETIYMNARITSNDSETSNEQTQAVACEIIEFGPYRTKFIEILRPEIIICGGRSARECVVKSIAQLNDKADSVDTVQRIGSYLVVSMPHFSRPQLYGGYGGLESAAKDVASQYFRSL